jgi:DNA invertase Pin-like site-specific DNA recombinase
MLRYFLYARKSTDEEDRQILSIESQLIELREFAKKEDISIIREFTESKTAKESGREVFNEMLKLVEQKINLNQKIDDLRQGRVGWLELAKDIIYTCNSVEESAKEKNFESLAKICQKAGSNFVLRDKILSFSFRKPFNFISSFVPTSSGQAR